MIDVRRQGYHLTRKNCTRYNIWGKWRSGRVQHRSPLPFHPGNSSLTMENMIRFQGSRIKMNKFVFDRFSRRLDEIIFSERKRFIEPFSIIHSSKARRGGGLEERREEKCRESMNVVSSHFNLSFFAWNGNVYHYKSREALFPNTRLEYMRVTRCWCRWQRTNKWSGGYGSKHGFFLIKVLLRLFARKKWQPHKLSWNPWNKWPLTSSGT